MLFGVAGVTDSDQMETHACQYININTAELWESLPEFVAETSYNAFKTAIHKLYPGSENNCKWSITDMNKLVGEQL
jgi:hypothetical protein